MDRIATLIASPFFIPEQFHNIPYNGNSYPGSQVSGRLKDGANCQVFAYEFLRHYGYIMPNFRSSDLWEDQIHTKNPKKPETLDLILLHDNKSSWGAHVGVYINHNAILHLSRSIGFPIIETLENLMAQSKYRYLIGYKRCMMKKSSKAIS